MPSTRSGADRKEISFRLYEIAPQFAGHLRVLGRNRRTIADHERTLSDFAGFLREQTNKDDIRHTTRDLIGRYAETICARNLDPNVKFAYLMRLKVFFRWAAAVGLLLSDPAAGLELPKKRKRKHPAYLSQKEMAALLDSIPTQTRESIRDRATLEVLYSTGLRTAELCRLNLSDINFADGTVRVLLGKGGKDRIVPAGKLALSYVDRYLQQARGLWPGPLFAHLQTPKGISGRYLARIIRKAAGAAGIRKHCTPRTFRHTFAIHLLERGAGIAHIGAMMGHADLSTTQIYTNIVKAELKRAHAAAHPAERRTSKLPEIAPQFVTARAAIAGNKQTGIK